MRWGTEQAGEPLTWGWVAKGMQGLGRGRDREDRRREGPGPPCFLQSGGTAEPVAGGQACGVGSGENAVLSLLGPAPGCPYCWLWELGTGEQTAGDAPALLDVGWGKRRASCRQSQTLRGEDAGGWRWRKAGCGSWEGRLEQPCQQAQAGVRAGQA